MILSFGLRRRKARLEYNVSENKATELIEDRIKFKLFYAEQHYNKLLQYQQEEGVNFLRTFVSRIRFEDELECLLAHLIGARDALLMRIKDKLGLPPESGRHANPSEILIAISSIG